MASADDSVIRSCYVHDTVLAYFIPFSSRDVLSRTRAFENVRKKLLNFNQENIESPVESKRHPSDNDKCVEKFGVATSADAGICSDCNGHDAVDGKTAEFLRPELSDYLAVILRLSKQCPFPDIRQASTKLLKDLEVCLYHLLCSYGYCSYVQSTVHVGR